MIHKNTTEVNIMEFIESGRNVVNSKSVKKFFSPNVLSKLVAAYRRTATKILHTVKLESPVLYRIAILILIIGFGCLFGLFLDDRTLLGVNVWIKPLKFAISISIHLLTVGYLISKYPYSNRKKNIINQITALTLLLEFLIIFYQGSRGVQSHYNQATPFDALLFLAMGIFVGINVLILALFIFDIVRLKLKTTKPMQWALLLG